MDRFLISPLCFLLSFSLSLSLCLFLDGGCLFVLLVWPKFGLGWRLGGVSPPWEERCFPGGAGESSFTPTDPQPLQLLFKENKNVFTH